MLSKYKTHTTSKKLEINSNFNCLIVITLTYLIIIPSTLNYNFSYYNCLRLNSEGKCIECKIGYILDNNGICKTYCSDLFDNCSLCGKDKNNEHFCVKCNQDYYYSFESKNCIYCSDTSNCSKNSCTDGLCEACSSNQSSHCLSCKSPIMILLDMSNGIVGNKDNKCACPEGTYKKDNDCFSCSETFGNYCTMCTSSKCTNCLEPYCTYSIQYNKCLCSEVFANECVFSNKIMYDSNISEATDQYIYNPLCYCYNNKAECRLTCKEAYKDSVIACDNRKKIYFNNYDKEYYPVFPTQSKNSNTCSDVTKYYDSINNICSNCSYLENNSDCMICNNNKECILNSDNLIMTCPSTNYFFIPGINSCLDCDVFSNTSCYLKSNGEVENSIVKGEICSNNTLGYMCKDCNSSEGCKECNPGYFLYKNKYFNYSATNVSSFIVGKCYSCSDFYQNCAKCNDNNCIECLNNYTLSALGTCVDSTTYISVFNDYNNVLLSGFDYIDSCDSIEYCTYCTYTPILNKYNQCLVCDDEYELNNEFVCIGKSCEIDNCINCNNNNCVSCKSGYYLTNNNDCSRCSLDNCSSCPTDNCDVCINGYYYNNENDTCSNCAENCSLCSKDSCTKCKEGSYLFNGNCVYCNTIENCSVCYSNNVCESCDSGHYLSNNTCYKCDENCSNCDKFSDICYECKENYKLTSSNKCVSCDVSNCEDCSTSISFCNKCKSQYYQYKNQCIKCSDNMPGCSDCLNYNVCTKCDSGLNIFYDSNSLTYCTNCKIKIDYCTSCDYNGNCQSCKEGYELINNECISTYSDTIVTIIMAVLGGTLVLIGLIILIICKNKKVKKVENDKNAISINPNTNILNKENIEIPGGIIRDNQQNNNNIIINKNEINIIEINEGPGNAPGNLERGPGYDHPNENYYINNLGKSKSISRIENQNHSVVSYQSNKKEKGGEDEFKNIKIDDNYDINKNILINDNFNNLDNIEQLQLETNKAPVNKGESSELNYCINETIKNNRAITDAVVVNNLQKNNNKMLTKTDNSNNEIDINKRSLENIIDKENSQHTDNCCICNDTSKTKLQCGGHLCLSCFDRITIEMDEGIYRRCNQCRKFILSVKLFIEGELEESFGPNTPVCAMCNKLNPTCIVPCSSYKKNKELKHLLHEECLSQAIINKICPICDGKINILDIK